MRFVSFAVACFGVVSAVFAAPSSESSVSVEECETEFASWLAGQDRAYDSSELFKRFTRFCKKLDQVNRHNAKDLPDKRGLNKFSAYSDEEYKELLGFRPLETSNNTAQDYAEQVVLTPTMNWADPATKIDWVTSGAVVPVKDQGQCGSCWTFSAAGAIESAWKLKGNALGSLAEQQILDCSRNGNYGCNGGNYVAAWQYLISQGGGITATPNYPYVAKQQTCQTGKPVTAKITSYRNLGSVSESTLLAALESGPVSVAIQAASSCFQQYRSGVLSPSTCACGSNLDHAVLLVGAGTDATTGRKYWKIKNSWGTWWGNQGYILMERALTTTGGMCGIQKMPAQPIV